MEPNKDLARIWRRAERALWCIVALLLIHVVFYGFSEWRYQQVHALRFSFSERAPLLADDMQWGNLLRQSQQRQKEVPADANGHFWAGVALMKMGDWKAGNLALRQAVKIEPSFRASAQKWRDNVQPALSPDPKPRPTFPPQ